MKPKDEYYYDAMDLIDLGKEGAKRAVQILQKARLVDPHYVQTYVGLANAYGVMGDKVKGIECINKAYDETRRIFPVWPEEMPWGDMDNRAYMRAIQWKAELMFEAGQKDDAIELYRLLLKLNPNDNQGVRYVLAGIYAGLSGDDVNDMTDEGNKKQNWDKLEKLVKSQNAKHKFWKEPKY